MAKKPKIDIVKVAELSPDNLNANRHTERGMASLEDSIRNNGFGRPTFADKKMRMIGGNGVLETVAQVAGTEAEAIVVHTTGGQMIVHVRDDLDFDDPETAAKARRMGLEDNRIQQQNLDWDPQILHALDERGVSLAGLWNTDEIDILRAARWDPPAPEDLPQPQKSARQEEEERTVIFTPAQWETIAPAFARIRDESAGVDVTAADIITIICARYLQSSTS